jgi:flagellar hook-associated protein 1 FlgK
MSTNLFALLSNAATSLAAQRAASSTAAHNIQNVNTPGYARQRAELATAGAELVGAGVWIGRGAVVGAVTQTRDRYIEAQLPRVFAEAAHSSAESESLDAVHTLDPERAGSLATNLGAFYAALQTLSQNPGDPGLRATALGAARTLASTFNRSSEEIANAQGGIDQRIGGWAEQVNASARAVADANNAIMRARAAGGAPNDLLDVRQRELDKLAELTGGVPVPQSDGVVHVILPGGGALVSGTLAGELSTVPDPANAGLVSVRLTAPSGGPAVPVPPGGLGGSIGGALAARDGGMARALAGLDTLARDLAGALNAAHAGNYGLDGVTGRPLFSASDGGPITAATLQVALSDASQLATASSAAAASGDAGGALALVATQRQALSGGADVQGTLSAITSAFGAEAQRASAYAEQGEGLKEQFVAMRESASGVSLDEELVAMQAAQRAYEAIAKVLQAADEMTKTLMQLR